VDNQLGNAWEKAVVVWFKVQFPAIAWRNWGNPQNLSNDVSLGWDRSRYLWIRSRDAKPFGHDVRPLCPVGGHPYVTEWAKQRKLSWQPVLRPKQELRTSRTQGTAWNNLPGHEPRPLVTDWSCRWVRLRLRTTEHGAPWWNDIERRKLLIRPPQRYLAILPAQLSSRKQEELHK
jgi:hypothetical protein